LPKRRGGGNSGPAPADAFDLLYSSQALYEIPSALIDPLADIFDPAELAARVKIAESVKRWCIEYPKGGRVVHGIKAVTVDAEQSRRMLCDAFEIIRVFAPRRARFLKKAAEYDRQARAVYPAMFKAGNPMSGRLQFLLKAWPEVKRFPDYALILGDFMAGFNMRKC